MSAMMQAYQSRVEEVEQQVWEESLKNGEVDRVSELERKILALIPQDQHNIYMELEELLNKHLDAMAFAAYRTGLMDGMTIGTKG